MTEARQWQRNAHSPLSLYGVAQQIVEWVRDNGGEARYEPGQLLDHGATPLDRPRIAVRNADGWAYAAPDNWILMTDKQFRVVQDVPFGCAALDLREFLVTERVDA